MRTRQARRLREHKARRVSFTWEQFRACARAMPDTWILVGRNETGVTFEVSKSPPGISHTAEKE